MMQTVLLRAATMLAVAIVVTIPIIFFNPLRMTLHPALVEVSAAILERDLTPPRRRQSSARQLTTLYFSTLFVMVLAGCGVAVFLAAEAANESAEAGLVDLSEGSDASLSHADVLVIDGEE